MPFFCLCNRTEYHSEMIGMRRYSRHTWLFSRFSSKRHGIDWCKQNRDLPHVIVSFRDVLVPQQSHWRQLGEGGREELLRPSWLLEKFTGRFYISKTSLLVTEKKTEERKRVKGAEVL